MLFPRAFFYFDTESAVRIMKQSLFGKYAVTGLIGAGANSQVYLVRHQILNQDRAVKRIPKSLPESTGFPLEAELLRSLNHPAIPTLYDVEEDESYFYLVEEYVQGESLEACLQHQQTISLNFLLQIGRQLCDVIGYLHAQPQPILYQDLKPEHVMVFGDRIKLIDYGTASYFKDHENPYRLYGTSQYAAPEKRAGGICDERTDIYGIGVILQEMQEHLPKEERSAAISQVIACAAAERPERRYANVCLLKEQLTADMPDAGPVVKEHFPKSMAVVGMRPGIGVTHLAVAWNSYLNAAGTFSLYVQQDHSGDLMRMAQQAGVSRDRKHGYFSFRHFRGTVSQRTASLRSVGENVCLIRDFGTYESIDIELEACDAILLVLGGRYWEMPQARELYETLCLHKKVIPVVNYGNMQAARAYAKDWRRNVYCFPLDEDPFEVSREKEQFFELLSKKERW